MAYVCSKDPGHQSEDADYCSVCGAKISGSAGAILQTPITDTVLSSIAGANGGETCPDCGTPRRSAAKFCEVCRYNFETHTAGAVAPPPATAPPPDPVPPVETPLPPDPILPRTAAPAVSSGPVPVPDAGSLTTWEVSVVVDPTLYTEPDPAVPCPVNEPELVFPLDFAENLLGRRSDRKDIHPEIPLEDPGVSRRHAKLLKQPDGSLIILDVGSSNGTFLNDVEVKPGVRTPVQPGDQITLGCWTRLTLRRAQG